MRKNVIAILLTFVFVGILSFTLQNCAREYSCEGERCGYYKDTFLIPPIRPVDKWPPRDTTSVDTMYNTLVAYYDFYIVDNSKVKKMYFNVQTKYIPGHFQIIDSIPIYQDRPDGYYTGSFNIKKYKLGAGVTNQGRIFYDSCFRKRDTFHYFFDIRYRDASYLRSDTITLIY